jgi:voltage-gated potassium channel
MIREKIYQIVTDSKILRVTILFLIFLSVTLIIIDTFDSKPIEISSTTEILDGIITGVFTIEYLLRIWTSPLIYPELSKSRAMIKYALSPAAIIDILAILPFYLIFLPIDLRILRVIRVMRILRLLKLTRYTSALSSIANVIKSRSRQLVSSLIVIGLLLFVTSIFMYAVEHDAQPHVFQNAFSGFWWAIETLTTVGYGDIYPITPIGKILSGVIAILGIGFVAVPTGIISAGFIEMMGKDQTPKESDKSNE